jgi:uncharacterized protein
VENGEDYLRHLGFREFRVRCHGELARIEIAQEEMPNILVLDRLQAISRKFREIGFQHVSLDCAGYRSGSMNIPRSQLESQRASVHKARDGMAV